MKTIERRNGYIFAEYSDPYSLENVMDLAKEVFEICMAENYKKVLTNFLNMPGKIRQLERFQLGVQGAQVFGHRVKVAVVYRKEEINFFAETVGINRGLHVHIFSEIDQALEWLEVEEAESEK